MLETTVAIGEHPRPRSRVSVMRASGVVGGFVVAACVLAVEGCVSKGCPSGYALVGGECAATDAGALDGGENVRNDEPLVTVARDADAHADDDADAGETWAADGGADSGAAAEATADGSGDAAPAAVDPCDGGVSTRCWRDGDEDGHAALDARELVVCDASCPTLWTALRPTAGSYDCGTPDATRYPGSTEQCNEIDDDCDNTVDEAASSACVYAHGDGACVGGACELASCEVGYDDCDVDETNGCEQPTNVDGHCGACGVTCHELASCEGGLVGACECEIGSFGDGLDCKGPGPLAAGYTSTCGIQADHSVICWGQGPASRPSASFRQIAVAGEHACGIETNDDVDCWGVNSQGQVKDLVGSFAQVAVGQYHSCALRLGRSVVCWGVSKANPGTIDDYGQAFDPPGSVYQQITAGFHHNCALKTDGTIHCWGSDQYGQSSPPEGAFVQVAAGGYHTCGLRADGSVTCWGAGKTDTAVVPQFGQSLVPGGVEFEYLSAGSLHTCGVTSSHTVVCWGAGDSEVVSFVEAEQAIPPPGTFVRVYAGTYHSCAIDHQLKAVCWGGNTVGQSDAPTNAWPLIP